MDFGDTICPENLKVVVALEQMIQGCKEEFPISRMYSLDLNYLDQEMLEKLMEFHSRVFISSRDESTVCLSNTLNRELPDFPSIDIVAFDTMEQCVKESIDVIVLSLLQQEPMCGFDVIKTIVQKFNVHLSQGVVYPILYSHKEKGYLMAKVKPDNKTKIYSLTESGTDFTRNRVREYATATKRILDLIATSPDKDSTRSAVEGVLQGNGNPLPEFHPEEALETGPMKMERNLRYRVRGGDIYLVEEKKLDRGVDVFLDLLSSDYSGIIISRSRPEKIRELCKVEVPLLWLSEDVSDKRAVYPELHFLEKIIMDYATRDKVVLLDRLDYLIVKTSFKEILGFIQRLNELFYRGGGVLIISMDPDTLNPQEYSLLEKETNEVKLRAEPNLSEELWEILGFVSQENALGKKPSQKEIAKQSNVTKTTMRKRINTLGSMELARSTKKGRYKVLELTEKGRTLWNSHNYAI